MAEIPKKIRKELDKLYEAIDNSDYVVDYKGEYLPKKGNIFKIRHYHHIDKNRKNNELWNLTPLSYNDHVIEMHSKNNDRFPEKEEHYKKYLLEEK